MPQLTNRQQPPVFTRQVPEIVEEGQLPPGPLDLTQPPPEPQPVVKQKTLSVRGGNPFLSAFADTLVGVSNPQAMAQQQEQRRLRVQEALAIEERAVDKRSQLTLQMHQLKRGAAADKLAQEREKRMIDIARLNAVDVTKDSHGNIIIIDKEQLLSAKNPEAAQSAITTIRTGNNVNPKTALKEWEAEYGIEFTPEERLLLEQALKGDETDVKSALNSVVARRQSAAKGDSARSFGQELRLMAAEDRMATAYRQEPAIKQYFEMQGWFDRIRTTGQARTAAGDLSMIFSYMKMLDPGSVVREGEQATAENARGVPDTIRALYNKVKTGAKLSESQRQDFTARAQDIFAQAKKRKAQTDKNYSDRAGRRKLEPLNVIQETFDDEKEGPQEGDTAVNKKTGERLVFRGGQWVTAPRN